MTNKKLELLVTAQERISFEYNIESINSFIANHENVPAKLVKSLLEQILPKEDLDLSKHYLKAKEKVKYVLEFIKLYPKYQLNWEFKELKSSNKKTYDFNRFALVMLYSFFQYEAEKKLKCSKNMVIQFFYDAFLEEIEADSSKLNEKKLSDYTLRVMAGLFAIAAGYSNSKNEKVCTPKEIYQFCRNSIN